MNESSENFPEPASQPSPPRVYPKLNSRLRLLTWLALLGGVLMIAGGGYELYRAVQLRNQGVQIVGRVHDSNTLNTGKGRTAYQLVLDYAPPGSDTVYRKEFSVPEAMYDEAVRTGTATVTYLPSDPTLSAVGPGVKPEYEPFAIGAGLIVIAAGIAYFRRRQWKKLMAYMKGES